MEHTVIQLDNKKETVCVLQLFKENFASFANFSSADEIFFCFEDGL